MSTFTLGRILPCLTVLFSQREQDLSIFLQSYFRCAWNV